MTIPNNICESERFLWIDLIKGISMIAVVIDHLYSYYQNLSIQFHTGFHVSLLILVSGFTSALSIQKRVNVDIKYTLKRLFTIFFPYLIATFIYTTYYEKRLNFSLFFQKLINFSAAGPFYFVLFFMELIAIAPFIYKLINHQKTKLLDIPILLGIYFLSFFLNKYAKINSLFGGGGILFGGSFLFLYCLGFFLKKYFYYLNKKITLFFLLCFSTILLLIFEYFNLIPKTWSNPANNLLFVYSLTIFSLIFSLYQLFFNKFFKILIPIAFLGKYSLYIFLYHTAFIDIYSYFFPQISKSGLNYLYYFLILLTATYIPSIAGYFAQHKL